MSITDHYDGEGFIATDYDFEVSGHSHDQVMSAAHDQAKMLFGERPFVLRSVDIRPGIEQLGSGVVVYFASVSATAKA